MGRQVVWMVVLVILPITGCNDFKSGNRHMNKEQQIGDVLVHALLTRSVGYTPHFERGQYNPNRLPLYVQVVSKVTGLPDTRALERVVNSLPTADLRATRTLEDIFRVKLARLVGRYYANSAPAGRRPDYYLAQIVSAELTNYEDCFLYVAVSSLRVSCPDHAPRVGDKLFTTNTGFGPS